MNITVSDVFKIASAVLLSIGGGGLLVIGLAGWLGRVWANRLMQNDIAAHAKDLEKLKSDFETTHRRIQADLDKAVHVHRVQFETEFRALSDIWVKLSAVLASVREALSASPHLAGDAGEQLSLERLKQITAAAANFTGAASAFNSAVDDQSPFYPKPIYEKLNEVVAILAEEEYELGSSKGTISLWLDDSAIPCLNKIVPLADQISKMIRQRIESLSLYRE
jgi:hypothetical protein